MLAQLPWRRGLHAAWVPWLRGFLARLVASRALLACAGALEVWFPFAGGCSRVLALEMWFCFCGCLGGVVSLRVRSLWKRLFLLSWLPWRRGHLSRAAALEALSPCSRCCLCSAICSLALLPLVAGLSVSLLGISDPFDCLSVPSLARLLPSACVAGLRHGYVGKFHMFA